PRGHGHALRAVDRDDDRRRVGRGSAFLGPGAGPRQAAEHQGQQQAPTRGSWHTVCAVHPFTSSEVGGGCAAPTGKPYDKGSKGTGRSWRVVHGNCSFSPFAPLGPRAAEQRLPAPPHAAWLGNLTWWPAAPLPRPWALRA